VSCQADPGVYTGTCLTTTHDSAGWSPGRCSSEHGSTISAHRGGPACLATVLGGNVHLNGHAAVGAGDPLPARASLGMTAGQSAGCRHYAQASVLLEDRARPACCPTVSLGRACPASEWCGRLDRSRMSTPQSRPAPASACPRACAAPGRTCAFGRVRVTATCVGGKGQGFRRLAWQSGRPRCFLQPALRCARHCAQERTQRGTHMVIEWPAPGRHGPGRAAGMDQGEGKA